MLALRGTCECLRINSEDQAVSDGEATLVVDFMNDVVVEAAVVTAPSSPAARH